MNGKRKLAFYEIAGGNFAREMQEGFESAQRIAIERGGKVKLTAVIEIGPPDAVNPRFGSIGYQLKLATPPLKSPLFTTELKDGAIISDGENVADAIQESLEFGPPKTAPFRAAESEE